MSNKPIELIRLMFNNVYGETFTYHAAKIASQRSLITYNVDSQVFWRRYAMYSWGDLTSSNDSK